MRKAVLATALFLASAATMAADNGIYLGASLGQANIDINAVNVRTQIDGDDTGFKFLAGLRPLDWFAVEASYVNFGEVEQGILATETDGISAFGVFFAPVGPVDLFAKAGLISFDTNIDVDGLGTVYQEDGTDLAYGVGVQLRLLSLGIRAEYERFDIDDTDDANMLSIGVTYTFL
jgi:Outer membrane protein beta-barrel domain